MEQEEPQFTRVIKGKMDLDQDLLENVNRAIAAGAPQEEAVMRARAIQEQRKKTKKPGFIRTLLTPFERVGRAVGSAGFELLRAGANPEMASSKTATRIAANPMVRGASDIAKRLGVDLSYGKENPFMDEALLQRMSDPKQAAIETAKTTAGLASYAVPFGKGANIVSKTILPGATSGALFEAGQPGATKESVGKGAKYGAAGALLFKGGEKLFRSLGGGGASVENRVGRSISGVGAKSKGKIFDYTREEEVLNALKREGLDPLKNSSVDIKRKLDLVYPKIESQIDDIVSKSKNKFPIVNTKDSIADYLGYGEPDAFAAKYFDKGNKTMVDAVNGELRWLASQSGKEGMITDKILNSWKKRLSSNLGPAFKRVSKELNTPLQQKEAALMDLWNYADAFIKTVNPKVKELTLRQSLLHKAAEGVGVASKKGGLRVPTQEMSFLGQELQKAQGFLARVVGGVGKVLKTPSALIDESGIALPTIEKGAALMGAGKATQEQRPLPALEMDTGGLEVDTNEILSPEGQWKWDRDSNDWVPNEKSVGGGLSKESINQKIAAATNKKEQDFWIGKRDALFGDEAGAELSADQEKAIRKLNSAGVLLDSFENMLSQMDLSTFGPEARVTGIGKKLAGLVGLDPATATFAKIRSGVRSQMARTFGEVGNLTETEQANAAKLIPDVTMSEEEIVRNLAELRKIIERLKEEQAMPL